MPMGVDFTAAFRACPYVSEYILVRLLFPSLLSWLMYPYISSTCTADQSSARQSIGTQVLLKAVLTHPADWRG